MCESDTVSRFLLARHVQSTVTVFTKCYSGDVWGTGEVHRALVGRHDGMIPLGRPRRIWEDNIKIDLQEVGWGPMDWIAMFLDRDRWRALVNAIMNLRVP
jgi:hypothetical protein